MSRPHVRDWSGECWRSSDSRVPDLVRQWLGPYEWRWSAPLPRGRRIAIVSSRLPRQLAPHDSWLVGMRMALNQLDSAGDVAVVAEGAAGWELVVRGAIRRQASVVCLHCRNPQRRTTDRWLSEDRVGPESVSNHAIHAWAVPEEHPDRNSETPGNELTELPERDRAAFAWADEIVVLRLRTGGNLHALLGLRLQCPGAMVRLVDLPGLQSPRARRELIDLGAQLWTPQFKSAADSLLLPVDADSETASAGSSAGNCPSDYRNGPVRIIPLPAADCWNHLSHTTRACVGPWPGQSREDFLDGLLAARPDADHSPLAALRRIIGERRLRASCRTIRGKFPVVSLTAVPLAELPRLHVFRSHRARWDFEPYGIAICRDWLEQRGARPVVYGDEPLWKELPVADRPFFQLLRRASTVQPFHCSTGQPSSIDWSLEREWRITRDVDLSGATPEQVIVFVPTLAEAEKLLATSPWPVTVLGA